jgi:hypothetical protein
MSTHKSADTADWPLWRWEKRVGAVIRFYEARLQPDLWGQWTVTLVWGRRDSPLGRVRHDPCGTYAEGLARVRDVQDRRARRGYAAVRDALVGPGMAPDRADSGALTPGE